MEGGVPKGLSDEPRKEWLKCYCPKCRDAYTPVALPHQKIEGAFFGTGFPHLLFMVHPEYRPKSSANQLVSRLFGFKIHPLAYELQQAASTYKAPPPSKMIRFNFNERKRRR